MPARSAIASWPTNVSRQPVEPHLQRRAFRVDGEVPELAAVAVGAAEELAVDEDAAADSDLAEDADEVLDVLRDALPVLGERGQVGLVVGAHGEAGEPLGDLGRNRDLRPPEVRGAEQRARLGLDEAGERHGGAGGDQILGSDDTHRLLGHPPQAAQDGAGLRAPVVRVDVPLVPDRPRQVLDAHRQVVDVHLEPDRDDPVAQLERLGRAADLSRTSVLARLAEQVELDQLAHEARHRAACQARLGSDPGTGARLAPCDLLQHDAEVGAAHGRLIGTRGRVGAALEAHARARETGDVSVDSVNPAAGFVWPSHKLRRGVANVKIGLHTRTDPGAG